MGNSLRSGNRKSRENRKTRKPELGYYIIVTDTTGTEKLYFNGLRDSIPKEFQDRIVVKVKETNTKDLVKTALSLANEIPQYAEPWIVFDRDKVEKFDKIIEKAEENNIGVAWSNPCIEIWFHAYFAKLPTIVDSKKCCSSFSKVYFDNFKREYNKANANIYNELNSKGDESKAIILAQNKLNDHYRNDNNIPSTMIPATTVHKLVKEIKEKF